MPRSVDEIEQSQPPTSIGLYVHVPFCRVKCGYCDFYSQVGGPEAFAPLVDAMLTELDTAVVRRGLRVETIFIGGGTPTVLPVGLLERLLRGIRGKGFPLEQMRGKGFPLEQPRASIQTLAHATRPLEFTVEANPATVDDAKAAAMAECGVDRVSMGAQSFDEAELAALDREHRPADVAASMDILRRAGLTRFNLDLICGVPGQTLASWRASLRAAIDLGPEHLSCYGLTYEPGTPLYMRRQLGRVRVLDDDLEAEMYLATMDTLDAAGYRQYEISNYARPGCECRHNLRYWHNLPGIGIGPSAASYLAGRRWRNVPDTREYVRRIQAGESPAIDAEQLSPVERAGETAMLNLRLTEGIDRESFRRMTGFDPLDLFADAIRVHAEAGRLVVDGDRIALTRCGRLVGDAVMADFLGNSGE